MELAAKEHGGPWGAGIGNTFACAYEGFCKV